MAVYWLYRKHCIKIAYFVLLCVCAYNVYSSYLYNSSPVDNVININDKNMKVHLEKIEQFYSLRTHWPTSKLGSILFKREPLPYPNYNSNKTFVILIWKHWEWLKNRHVYSFNSKRDNVDMLAGCSVKNCIFTGDNKYMNTADAVVVHLQRGYIPSVEYKNPKQRWIFLNDEAPTNVFQSFPKNLKLDDLKNIFNWSMTYRSDADVPVPYGRTLPLDKPLKSNLTASEIASLIPNWKNKIRDIPATILMSHCGVLSRDIFLHELRKYLKVDVYGKCSDKKEFRTSCPGHFKSDCDPVSKYLFYLVLENSNCFQYLTEKVFYNAYSKGAIPVIWGPSYEDLKTLLPPNSFLHADENTDVQSLAKDIEKLAKNDDLLLLMHEWRNHFKVVNEHGYFGTKSHHLCRLCEAMNYNDGGEKILSEVEIKWFLDPVQTCKRFNWNV